ncbi:MAG: protein kinase, partial [Planctomycetes bacterium]|nr:protein kinase [Planctomycetota bacterium]
MTGATGAFDGEQSATLPTGSTPAGEGSATVDTTRRCVRRSARLEDLQPLEDEASLALRLTAWRAASFAGTAARYQVAGTVGSGSQGVVFEVLDQDCRRRIALKTLRDRGRNQQEAVSRFVHEAQITAQLEHPGIVPVHDLEVLPDGTVFYTMKRIEGANLADLIEHYQGEPAGCAAVRRLRDELVQAFLKVCDAVAFAHSRGVVHRDLKPRNIMVGSFGEVLVLDWGLAKVLADGPDRHEQAVGSVRTGGDGGDAHATLTGVAVGTPAYMSPEQARGLPATPASDIYSLGVVLYHVLGGVSPYERGDVRATMQQCVQGRWTPLGRRPGARGLPRRLLAVVHKAMALAPADRYASVDALAADLRRFLAGDAVAAYRESPLEGLLRQAHRHRRAVLAATAVALLAGAGALAWWGQLRAETRVQIEQLRATATTRESESRYGDARRLWERVLELDPADRAARDSLRRAAAAEEREQAALLQRHKAEEARVWRGRAEQAAAAGGESGLLDAASCYLRALGLEPDDPVTSEGYRRVVAQAAEITAARRQAEERTLVEEERRAAAASLEQRAEAAAREGTPDAAVGFLESALALWPSPERGRRLGTLIASRQQAEASRQAAGRRAEAERELSAASKALEQGTGEIARDHLERARGFDPAHPALAVLEERVRTRLRLEQAEAAEGQLASAAEAREQADRLAAGLQQADEQVR